MNNFKLIIIGITSVLNFTSCSSNHAFSPSKNVELNNITKSTAEKKSIGSMQQSLDRWLENEWTPKVEENSTIKFKNQDKDRDFTLQEYIDKSKVYMRESNSTTQDSHYQKVKSLPVIGK